MFFAQTTQAEETRESFQARRLSGQRQDMTLEREQQTTDENLCQQQQKGTTFVFLW
jgi:hypothetical protein